MLDLGKVLMLEDLGFCQRQSIPHVLSILCLNIPGHLR